MKVLVSCITLLVITLAYQHVAGQFTRPPVSTITDCEGSVFDIVFVLDSSGSVGYDNFTVMKSFVKAVVENLEIAENKTRVGLMTYSRYPFIRINLNDYTNKTELLAAVDKVPYIPGITETQSALQLLLQEGFKGDRPYAPHVSVVITDGKSFHTNQTAAAAEAARQSGITMIAVGIGTEINDAELRSIASDPDTQHVFNVSNFASLEKIVTTLTEKTCKATALTPAMTSPLPTVTTTQPVITQVNETSENCNRTLADLVFVLDSSGSLGFQNFANVKSFAIDIVNYLDIGPNFTKVGVITYSNYPNRRFTLDSYTDKLQLVNAINQIPYYPGNTETDKALDLLRLEGFEGDRPDAPNIAIIVTDGLSTNPGLTKISSSQLKKSGITVFAVGIGAEIDTAELKYISSDPDDKYVFFVGNFSSLPTIESTVARTTCAVKLVTTQSTIPTTQTTTTTTTTRMTTPSCTARVADVMFVLDTSGSVGADNFVQIKQFVKQTISVFDIASLFTRVGIITYSTNADIAFPLNTYNTTGDLYTAIDGLVFTHGGTNTGEALELLRTQGFLYDRDEAPNIAIVITDGLSKSKVNTKLQATLAKDDNITIIAIGVGNSTDQEELNNIATFDVLNNRNLVYQVGDFAALETLNNTVATVACGFVIPETTPTTTTPQPTLSGCHDTIPNCDEYGSDICYDYRPWANAHCAATCGFCVGESSTTTPVCGNKLNNCHEYGTYICTESSLIAWTKNNCAQYCGICGNNSIPTQPSPTPKIVTSPPPCVDKLDNCNEYGGQSMCKNEQYRSWAKSNCYKYCGYCIVSIPEIKVNNITCPAWELPSACTMATFDGSCCPLPVCPDGYLLTAKAP
ncbi:von Willebrand factor (vWF) type A domain [Mactra antiquata]